MKLQSILKWSSWIVLAACSSTGAGSDDSTPKGRVMLDTRGLGDALDLTNLPPGQHDIVINAYVPTSSKWQPSDTATVAAAVRIHRLTPAVQSLKANVTAVEVPGHPNRRQVHIGVDLVDTGTWLIEVYGDYVSVATAGPEAELNYGVDDPKTLPVDSYFAANPLVAPEFLRTVGHCPHAVAVDHRFAADGTAVGWTVRFSEPLANKPFGKVPVKNGDGKPENAAVAVGDPAGNAVEIDMPVKWQPNGLGMMSGYEPEFPSDAHELSGAFTTTFGCTTAPLKVVLPVWLPGATPLRSIVAPIGKASILAGGSK